MLSAEICAGTDCSELKSKTKELRVLADRVVKLKTLYNKQSIKKSKIRTKKLVKTFKKLMKMEL
jgi:hypothetical protein